MCMFLCAGDTAGSVANGVASGSLQVVDRIRRMTLERGDSPSVFASPQEDQTGLVPERVTGDSWTCHTDEDEGVLHHVRRS